MFLQQKLLFEALFSLFYTIYCFYNMKYHATWAKDRRNVEEAGKLQIYACERIVQDSMSGALRDFNLGDFC